MRRIILTALITCLAVGTAAAQSCDSQAVSANGKPLHGAAKNIGQSLFKRREPGGLKYERQRLVAYWILWRVPALEALSAMLAAAAG